MILAVTYENGQVFQHFGHTGQFKLFQVDGGAVTSSRIVDTNGSGHGALAGFLAAHHVDALICGGIGGGAVHLKELELAGMPEVLEHLAVFISNCENQKDTPPV